MSLLELINRERIRRIHSDGEPLVLIWRDACESQVGIEAKIAAAKAADLIEAKREKQWLAIAC